MGIAADSLFNALMSWVRALVNAIWALFSADRTTALEFLGKNWMAIAAVLIICGLVIDWIVWLIRWQPYHLWARRIRKLLRLDELEDEPKKEKRKAHAAVLPEKRYARPEPEDVYDESMEMDGDEEMPWSQMQEEESEENSDWLRMQEEARMRAEAERLERERLEREAREAERERRRQEAYEAEQARIAREAYAAEQARLAQEAYEAEQARLAQEEYARQMEEYERQKAQYERDLAEYERQKAEYEAQLAAQEAYEEQQTARPAEGTARRRRTALTPEEEQYTQVIEQPVRLKTKQTATRTQKPASAKAKKPDGRHEKPSVKHNKLEKTEKAEKNHALLSRVAKLIEPEEEELITRKTLPPRVDMNDAFRTAKLPVVTPPRSSRRKK